MKTIEYNTCDCCGRSEDTNKLWWTEYDVEDKDPHQSIYDYDAVCSHCLIMFLPENQIDKIFS